MFTTLPAYGGFSQYTETLFGRTNEWKDKDFNVEIQNTTSIYRINSLIVVSNRMHFEIWRECLPTGVKEISRVVDPMLHWYSPSSDEATLLIVRLAVPDTAYLFWVDDKMLVPNVKES